MTESALQLLEYELKRDFEREREKILQHTLGIKKAYPFVSTQEIEWRKLVHHTRRTKARKRDEEKLEFCGVLGFSGVRERKAA